MDWKTFERELAIWMKSFSEYGLKFSAGYQSIPGFPSDGFRSDAALTNGRVLVALEVEVKQSHSDTNVGAHWLLSEHLVYDKVIFIHLYTPGYNSYGWRKTLGEFYVKKMAETLPFQYHLLDQRQAVSYSKTMNEAKTFL